MEEVIWNCFDPDAEVGVSSRNRPHWDQRGAVTFVTFRLFDSLPGEVLQRWRRELAEWLAKQGYDDSDVNAVESKMPKRIRNAYQKFLRQRWNENLDDCHGSCLLKRPGFAILVAESLRKFDGERYDVDRLVIMPNHVHLLVQMRPDWELTGQCESWLRYTGRQLNEALGRRGPMWSEPFDHVVRNSDQFEYLRQYIAENSGKARLHPGDALLWIRGQGYILPERLGRPRNESEKT